MNDENDIIISNSTMMLEHTSTLTIKQRLSKVAGTIFTPVKLLSNLSRNLV